VIALVTTLLFAISCRFFLSFFLSINDAIVVTVSQHQQTTFEEEEESCFFF